MEQSILNSVVEVYLGGFFVFSGPESNKKVEYGPEKRSGNSLSKVGNEVK